MAFSAYFFPELLPLTEVHIRLCRCVNCSDGRRRHKRCGLSFRIRKLGQLSELFLDQLGRDVLFASGINGNVNVANKAPNIVDMWRCVR